MTDSGPPSRSLPASEPSPAPAPLVAPTGSPGLNSVIDAVNVTAAPFQSAPPAEGGTAGAVAQGLGGVLGVVGAPAMIIDTAFASLTAPIAKLFPALPAITLGGLHIGTPHAHTHPPSLVPPAPPVPLPSIGALMGSGSITVLIGGLPAARAGDIGIAATCGSLAPPFCVFTGSSNVFIGGARAARLGDITQHCNPQGGAAMGAFSIAISAAAVAAGAAGAIAGGSPWAAAQAAADAAVLAVRLLCGKDPGVPPCFGALLGPPVPNVLIGGFPCPPIGDMAVGGLLKALKALGRAARARASRRGNAACANGSHPIYLVTGENFDAFTDFVSGGLFEWRRHYTTARAKVDSPLGHGFRHYYQRSLSLRLHRATFTDWDGVVIEFPRIGRGSDVTRSNGYVLRRLDRGYYELTYRNEPAMYFSGGEFEGQLKLTRIAHGRRELFFAYDAVGRLTAAVEKDKETTEQRRFRFQYDAENHLTHLLEVPPQEGPSWAKVEPIVRAAYEYSDGAELLRAWDAEGGTWAYDYDAFHRWTRQSDPRGYTYSFRYDALGRCVEASGDDGLWWCKVDYYPDRRLTRYVEGHEDAAWEYHYDTDGFVTKIVDPFGGVKLRERDGEGKIVREVDAGGRAIAWLYDGDGAHYARADRFGNLFPPEEEMPRPPNPFGRALPRDSLGYAFGGLVRAAADAVFGVDESVLLLVPPELSDVARTALRLRAPEPVGTPRKSTAPRIDRDALGRKIREVDVAGRTRTWEYDPSGNLVASRDADGRRTEQTTASWNLVGERRDPLGNAMKYEYSRVEQVIGVTDPNGNETRYDYDAKGRLALVHGNGRLRDEYVYDAGDHFVEKKDGSGATLFVNEPHENHFVGVRRLASGGIHRFDYDEKGRITEASTEAHEVRLGYWHGRRPVKDLRDGVGTEHRWQGGSVRISEVLGRFQMRQTWTDKEIVFTNSAGRRTSLVYDERGSVRRYCSNGTVELLQYDEAGRLEAQLTHRHDAPGRAAGRSASYTYSAEGDLLRVTDSERGVTRYEVDAAHRLVAEITPEQERLEYVHDAANNVVAKPGLRGLRVGPGNVAEVSSDETFGFDSRDRLAERIGRDGATTRYRYDSFDMLLGATRTRPGGAAEPEWTATYDALGRRISSGTADQRREFYWDGDRLSAEIFPDGRFRIYQYASREALAPIAFVDYASRDAEPESGATYHVFSNPVGIPLYIQDEQGEVVWAANRVDPYGGVEVRPGAALEYNLRWPGHYFDPETGLHYNRYRYYDPVLGRYLQSDPIGYEGSDVNLYAYCPNPLVQVDVLGLAHGGKPKDPNDSSSDNDGQARPPRPQGDAPPPRRPRLSDAEGQAAADRIHQALPPGISRVRSTTTVTQLADGRIVVTNSNGVRPAQREAARDIFGPDVLFTNERGSPDYVRPVNRPLDDPNATTAWHGEPQGIQAGNEYGSPAERQWSSSDANHGGAACEGCEQTQREHGVGNGTGFQSRGGRFDRGGSA